MEPLWPAIRALAAGRYGSTQLRDYLRPGSSLLSGLLLLAAGIGTVWLFQNSGRHDFKLKRCLTAMLPDAVLPVAMLLATGVSIWIGWQWLDSSLVSVIVLLILFDA